MEAKARLYRTAIRLFAKRGYEAATLRDIASEAGVSAGLLYKYFPSKSAVVLELYDQLSLELVQACETMPAGPWWKRSLHALDDSLGVLREHRSTLKAIMGRLLGDSEQGLFSEATAFSRARVHRVFVNACSGSKEGFTDRDACALANVVYVAHLAVILWWLLDQSPHQRATKKLLALLPRLGRAVGWALRLPGAWAIVRSLGDLIDEGLLGKSSGSRSSEIG